MIPGLIDAHDHVDVHATVERGTVVGLSMEANDPE